MKQARRLLLWTLIAVSTAISATLLFAPKETSAQDGCPPDVETCVETQYYYNQGCHGSYCYSDREMCCIT